MDYAQTYTQWSVGMTRVRWGAVFAGFVVGLATQIMLTLLGLAVGAWAIDIREAQSAEGVPIGTGIWTGISMLIAAFTGGYVTARLSGTYLRSDGLYQAAVVWGFNWLVFAWLTTTAMATMIGGLFSALGSTLQTVGGGIGSAATAVMQQAGGGINVSSEELRRQLESVLAATGKPELQPGQIQQESEQIAGQARTGQAPGQVTESALAELREKLTALDREAAVNVMVNKMGMTEPQARQVVQSTIGILGPLQERAQQVREQSTQMGNAAIDRMGTLAMWLFLLAALTLTMSLIGGAMGTPDEPLVEAQSESFRTAEMRKAG